MAEKNTDDLTPEEKRKLYYQLALEFETNGYDKVERQLKEYQREIDSTNSRVGKFGIAMKAANDAVQGIGRAINQAVNAVDAFGRNFGAASISADNAKKILKDTNLELLQLSARFRMYGESIGDVTRRTEELRTKYKLTYAEANKLQSGIAIAFNTQRPQDFVKNGLDPILRGFNNNIDAAQQFITTLEDIIDTRPDLEKMMAQGDYAGLQAAVQGMVDRGEMRAREARKILQPGFAAMQRAAMGGEEAAAAEKLARPFETDKQMQKDFETGLKAGAEKLYAFQDAIGLTKENLEKLSGVISSIVSGATVTGGVTNAAAGSVGGMVDMVATAYMGYKGIGMAKNVGKYALGGGKEAAEKTALEAAEKLAAKEGVEAAAKMGGKALAKSLSKKIIGLGVIAGTIYGAQRALQGDFVGAGLEVASGAAGSIPGIGTAASVAIDAGIAARDINKAIGEEQSIASAGVSAETNKQMTGAAAAATEFNKQIVDPKISQNAAEVSTVIQTAKDRLKITNEYLQSSLKLTQSMSNIYSKSGNYVAGIAFNEKALNDIYATRQEDLALIAKIEDKLRNPEISPEERKKNEKDLNEAKEAYNAKLQEELEARKRIIEINQPQLEQLNKTISLQESQIALLDSAGMGLKAQASARQEVVQMLGQQIQMEKQQEIAAQKERALAIAEMQSADPQRREELQGIVLEMENKILDSRQKQVQATQKQADITKSLREGYISAIQAMNSGAGVFTRIVLKQDQGYGTLAAMRRDGLNALTTGGVGMGRTGSARFGAGGYTEGQAGAYEQKVLSSIGVSASNSLQQNVAAMVNYTQKASQGMSAAAASYGQGPLGSGAFAGAGQTGVTKYGNTSSPGSRSSPSQVDITALKNTMVDIFSKIGQEIVNETIKRLRQ